MSYDQAMNEESGLLPPLTESANFGRPGGPGYGASDEIVSRQGTKQPLKKSSRPDSYFLPACVSFLVPWILFIVVYAATSFSLHYNSPIGCWFIVFLGCAATVGGFYATFRAYSQGKNPTWYAFLSILMLIALILGVSLGSANYLFNLRTFYDTSNLNKYDSVDPRTTSGQQMMDAGQITFVSGAIPDLSKAMGFRDREMYCVTPVSIVADTNSTKMYDFWAVGTNCCTGAPDEFHCSEYDNKYAHSGLRVVDAEKQAFYRLAVQQAEAAYHIHAPHPIFLYWLQDPNAELDAYADEGMTYYLIGIFSHLAFQVVVVCVGTLTISRFG